MLDEKEPTLEIINDEETPDTPSSVTVDLENPDKEKIEKSDEKPKEQPKDARSSDFSKLNNTIAYQTRQLEKAMRELSEVKSQLSRPQAVVEDDVDAIAANDWKLGVKKLVEKDIEAKVQELLEKRENATRELQKRSAAEGELQKSKQRVLQRYPSIEDQGSEENKIYLEVINEDQTLLGNIHGPEIAMYRMEERLREMGRTPESVKPIVDREVNRLTRAGASSVVGRQQSPNGKITLTKEQKEFCDHYSIPYGQYAKNLKSQDLRGGVEA